MFFNIRNPCAVFSKGIYRITGMVSLLGSLTACTVLSGKAENPDPEITGSVTPSEYGMGENRALFRTASVIMQNNKGYEKIGKPYQVKGIWYYPAHDPNYVKTGKASWYGKAFHGKRTANGETFDLNRITAAHPTMPLPSYAKVTNLANGSSLVVRVNDRGPFSRNRIIDLSHRAAQMLGYVKHGVADVRVEYVGPAPLGGQDHARLASSFSPAHPFEDEEAVLLAALDGNGTALYMEQAALGTPAPKTPALPEYGPRISTKPFSTSSPVTNTYIALGTFRNRARAEALHSRMAGHGHVDYRQGRDEQGHAIYSLELSNITTNLNSALQDAWNAGALDAFVVRSE